ncbi:MAG: glutaredoxin domain-containing protein [Gammaproteobacteria bacterium]|nr:glutaredoxin domain-containing protein [Gammaproteobacteria bacterium]
MNETSKTFVDRTIADPEHPVTLFSLSWCSYCRAARQLLEQLGIPYQMFELDRGEFLEPRLQNEVRARLQQLTRSSTLPQLFIGGESLGGYTETAAARGNGKLADVLARHAIQAKSAELKRPELNN